MNKEKKQRLTWGITLSLLVLIFLGALLLFIQPETEIRIKPERFIIPDEVLHSPQNGYKELIKCLGTSNTPVKITGIKDYLTKEQLRFCNFDKKKIAYKFPKQVEQLVKDNQSTIDQFLTLRKFDYFTDNINPLTNSNAYSQSSESEVPPNNILSLLGLQSYCTIYLINKGEQTKAVLFLCHSFKVFDNINTRNFTTSILCLKARKEIIEELHDLETKKNLSPLQKRVILKTLENRKNHHLIAEEIIWSHYLSQLQRINMEYTEYLPHMSFRRNHTINLLADHVEEIIKSYKTSTPLSKKHREFPEDIANDLYEKITNRTGIELLKYSAVPIYTLDAVRENNEKAIDLVKKLKVSLNQASDKENKQ